MAGTGGLDDFGPDGWQEPLEVLCRSFRTEAGLSAFGTVSIDAQLTQFLKNRLLIADVVRRHPEVLDVPVTAPIVIAGLPRTGTTHLHNLISADPAMRFLPYWESIEPVPAAGEPLFGDGNVAPRIARCDAALAMAELWTPELRRMHEMSTWHAHEEIHLLSIDCSSMFFDTLAPMPTWREYYRARDQTPHYAYMRQVLQVLQFLRGGDRWVLKSPQHLEQFHALAEVFPDATFVVTHRDPGDVLVSMATMIAYVSRVHLDRPDPVALGRHWERILTDMLQSCVTDRELLPAERSVDVRFDEFMADDLAAVAAVYELAGQPLDARARAAHAGLPGVHTVATATARSCTTQQQSASTPWRRAVRWPTTASASASDADQPRVMTSVVGRTGVASGRNQRNQISPWPWPWVRTQLGRPGSRSEITIIHEPSGSRSTWKPLMVTGSWS